MKDIKKVCEFYLSVMLKVNKSKSSKPHIWQYLRKSRCSGFLTKNKLLYTCILSIIHMCSICIITVLKFYFLLAGNVKLYTIDTESKTHPYFGSNEVRNVTTTVGHTAYLHCQVQQLGDKAVSSLLYVYVCFFTAILARKTFFFIKPSLGNSALIYADWTRISKFITLQILYVFKLPASYNIELQSSVKQTTRISWMYQKKLVSILSYPEWHSSVV